MPKLHDWLSNLRIINTLIDGKCSLFKDKLNYKIAGDTHFPSHQDMLAGWPETNYITVGIAIDYATTENGCLYMAPNQHHSKLSSVKSIIPDDQIKQWIPMEMDPGTVIFFSWIDSS